MHQVLRIVEYEMRLMMMHYDDSAQVQLHQQRIFPRTHLNEIQRLILDSSVNLILVILTELIKYI